MTSITRAVYQAFRGVGRGVRTFPYTSPAAWIDSLVLAGLIVGAFAVISHP